MVSRPLAKRLPSRSIIPTETPLAILLLTPSHFGLLEEDNTFIPDLLSQTHDKLTRGQEIDVLLAVVDKISYPGYRQSYDLTSQKFRERIGYTGNGIAVLLLNSESAAPDLWAERNLADEQGHSQTPRRSTLAFQFDVSLNFRRTTEVPQSSELDRPQTIRLPVANTIFRNGRTSTIKAQRWIVDENVTGLTLRCAKSKWLDQQVLKISESNWFTSEVHRSLSSPADVSFTKKLFERRLRLLIPLKPITEPRFIAAAMGNVIRGLYTEGSSGTVIPASRELEPRIDQWISELGVENQTVEVWALIHPNTNQSSNVPSEENRIVRESVRNGSHLHKVLSGGGGWGNRQGLLALDPELDFDDAPELSSIDVHEIIEPEAEKRRNLGQIVNLGDIVQFFVRNPQAPFAWPSPKQNTRDESCEFSELASIVFGTLPSTVDQMPLPEGTIVDESKFSPCIYAWGHFGMLSEQGMSLTTTMTNGQSSQTKIDVPYTKLSMEGGRIPPPRRFRIKKSEFQINEIVAREPTKVTNQRPSTPKQTTKQLQYKRPPSTPPKQGTDQGKPTKKIRKIPTKFRDEISSNLVDGIRITKYLGLNKD